METIKISQESLDAFKGGKTLIPAPIDNKNLSEDSFEDEVFGDFYACKDHRDGSRSRHLFGTLNLDSDDYYVDGFIEAELGGHQRRHAQSVQRTCHPRQSCGRDKSHHFIGVFSPVCF